jgi:hypothetical protein
MTATLLAVSVAEPILERTQTGGNPPSLAGRSARRRASARQARAAAAARAGDTRYIRGVRLRLGGCLRQRGIDELLELDSQTLGIVAAGGDGGVGPEMFVCDVQRR